MLWRKKCPICHYWDNGASKQVRERPEQLSFLEGIAQGYCPTKTTEIGAVNPFPAKWLNAVEKNFDIP